MNTHVTANLEIVFLKSSETYFLRIVGEEYITARITQGAALKLSRKYNLIITII